MTLNVRQRTTLLRAVLATLLALAGSVIADFGNIHDPTHRAEVIAPAVIGALVVLLGGWIAVGALASLVRRSQAVSEGHSKGLSLTRLVSVAGRGIVILWALGALGVSIEALLLGGALTGVVLGIAAQQTLGNIFAGLVLLVVRPFTVGQDAVLRSTLGEYAGLVQNIGLFYVTIHTAGGKVDIPNAVALASAVGPGARQPKPAEQPGPPERPVESAAQKPTSA